MDKDLVISVVAPVSGEIRVTEFVRETVRVLESNYQNYEIILVDHGCEAHAAEIARATTRNNQNIRLIILSKASGKHIALTAGLDHSIGDFVVLMSADLEDSPHMIPALVSRAQEGIDVVYGLSPEEEGLGEQFVRLVRRLNPTVGQQVMPRSEFLALSRRAVNALVRLKEQRRFLGALLEHVESSVDTITVRAPARKRPRRSLVRSIRLELGALIAFSNRPLRYVSLLSLGISGAALLATAGVVIDRFINDQVVEGWTSLMVVLLVMFCMLFFFLAVISEYISQILGETKNRPLYSIREEIGGTRFEIGSLIEERL